MDVLMPQLGETVAEGTVAEWRKAEGDPVEANEIILDVETDKVSMEIPAPAAGTLSKLLVEAGQTVEVGTVLAVIAVEGEAVEDEPGKKEVTGEPADEHSTGPLADKLATASVADDEVSPPSGGPQRAAGKPPSTARAAQRNGRMRLSPAVRRLAAEHDIELTDVEGSGRNGRITRRDVIEYLEGEPKRAAGGAPSAPAGRGEPHAALAGGTVPFNRIRKRTAEHMVRSKATSPHVLQAVEVDFSGVDRTRRALRESWKAQRGWSLTYLPFIAHAVCRALAQFPHVNASVENDTLILHEHVNLAIAIDLGAEGLVAPVIHSAEAKSVPALAESIQDLAARARDNRLKPDDLSGGTYTLSNSGTFGTLITAPIINQPQVAILSTDGVRKKPVVVEHPDGDSIAIRPVGVLAQSFDHRAIDGAYSAAFLDRVRKNLEQTDWFREV